MHRAVALLTKLDAQVIAQVHGVVVAAGLPLRLQADFVIAAEGTHFSFAYVNTSISCDLGASSVSKRTQ